MNTTLTIDKAGRVILPKPVRDRLQLAAGDSLALESSGDQIILRPVRGTATMRKKDGFWVFRTGERISSDSVNETIQQLRDERLRSAVHPHEAKLPKGSRSR